MSEQVRYDAGFVYTEEHASAAKRHFERVVSVLEPKVKTALGET